MPTRTKTASLYLRISLAREESDSLERQERDLRLLAEQEGYTVVAVHTDEGISGAATSRPAFRAWLTDAQNGRADALLAWRFDRISREGLGAVARILDILKASGARLLTHGDRMDSDSASFRLTAAVLSEVAYAERESIRARVSSRQANDRRKGRWSRPRPFGFVVQRPDMRLVPHPTEGPILRSMVDAILDGASLRSIAADLNARGVPAPSITKALEAKKEPPLGRQWGISTVHTILSSWTTCGVASHAPRDPAQPSKRVPNQPVYDEDGDLVLVGEGVMTVAERRRVMAALEARSLTAGNGKRVGSGRPASFLLTGFLFCGGCGARMSGANRRGGDYRCSAKAVGKTCSGVVVRLPDVDEAVARAALRRLAALEPGDPMLDAVLQRWLARHLPETEAERAEAQDAVQSARARLSDLEDARFIRQEFEDADGPARYDRLRARVVEGLQAAEARLRALPPVTPDAGFLLDSVASWEAWEASSLADRRDVLGFVLHEVLVRKALWEGEPFSLARLTFVWVGEDVAMTVPATGAGSRPGVVLPGGPHRRTRSADARGHSVEPTNSQTAGAGAATPTPALIARRSDSR